MKIDKYANDFETLLPRKQDLLNKHLSEVDQRNLLNVRNVIRSLKKNECFTYYIGKDGASFVEEGTKKHGSDFVRAVGYEVYSAYMDGLCHPFQKKHADGKFEYLAMGA